MATILKVNDKSKAAKLFLAYVKTLSFVKVEEKESPYDPDFVKKIKKAEKQKGGKVVTAENLWENIK